MSLLNTEPPTPSGSPKEAHLQVAFGGESAPTDVAHKGLLTGVSPLVDLQRAGRREVLPAPRAAVLLGLSSGLGRQQRRHTWGHGRGTHKPTGNFNFDIGWLGSDTCRRDTAPTFRHLSAVVLGAVRIAPSISRLRLDTLPLAVGEEDFLEGCGLQDVCTSPQVPDPPCPPSLRRKSCWLSHCSPRNPFLCCSAESGQE